MGLGLSIAKRHALLSGGDLVLMHGELGGAAFKVTLPVRADSGSGAPPVTRIRHVVVVDDEPNIGRSLRLILEGEGYRVTLCDSAAQFHAERAARAAPISTCWICVCRTATASTCSARSGRATTRRRW